MRATLVASSFFLSLAGCGSGGAAAGPSDATEAPTADLSAGDGGAGVEDTSEPADLMVAGQGTPSETVEDTGSADAGDGAGEADVEPKDAVLDEGSADRGTPETTGADSVDPACDGCLVGGECHSEGAANPLVACEVCDPEADAEAWSAAGEGAPCDDGEACTRGDRCEGGACVGDTYGCGEHGTCSEGEDGCDCAEGFAGGACEECAEGFGGYPSCAPPGCDGVFGSGAAPDDCGICLGDNPRCSAGHTSMVFTDSQYEEGGLPVEIFYPAYEAGDDVAFSVGRFPVLVFGHGYQQSFGDYAYVRKALVRRGYILVFPDKLSANGAVDIDAYAADLGFLLHKMNALGADEASPFFGHVAEESALMGHSTGGGAAIVAAEDLLGGEHAPLTVVGLAPLGRLTGTPISGTSPIGAAASVTIPVLVVDGEEDCITPVDESSEPIFDALPGPALRYRVTIQRGDHCGFGDPEGPGLGKCELAEAAECTYGLPPVDHQGPTMGSAGQNPVVLDLLRPWLDSHLKAKASAMEGFVVATGAAGLSAENAP